MKKMGEEITLRGAPHVLLFPYPSAQGHMNPLLQFGKHLMSKGLKVTLVTTIFLSKSIHIKPSTEVAIETISDGYDETRPTNYSEYGKRFKEVGSRSLVNLIRKLESSCYPVSCLVYDSILPWTQDVAKELDIIGAVFFTMSVSVSSIYYHAFQGVLKAPVTQPEITLPRLPTLSPHDLPSHLYNIEELYAANTLALLTGQFTNLDKADYAFFNTFDKLESELVSWMTERWPHVKTIGPLTLAIYLNKQNMLDKDHSINFIKPSEKSSYLEWLDARESESVVYVSFGSVVPVSEDQMKEVAWGLKSSNKNFLWVVREKEEMKLPVDFLKETSGQGLVVKWCSQIEVLTHEAIGCFLTHCGWNSVLEGLSFEVPLVAMPVLWDQPTHGKFVGDVWGVGLRAKPNDKRIVNRDELVSCVHEVMEGELSKKIKMNISNWNKLAREATDAGGSSCTNIEEFVNHLHLL